MTQTDMNRIRKYIQSFQFEDLFIEELGWDQYNQRLEVLVEGEYITLTGIAEKRGLVAFILRVIPESKLRRKIEQQVAKIHRENIIIYTDQTQQIWQWVRREPGKPLANRERPFNRGQSGEHIAQILAAIAFSLDEEDDLTIVDVSSRVRAAFDMERVTKRFYDRFKRQHDAFLAFIEGIPDADFQRWYASVMLNRVMFIYFVQSKGFLDGDLNYLKNRLAKTEGNFYRDFLCPLFFEGFAKKDHTPQIRLLLGDVPYLNGGLFLKHQIEEKFGAAIQIENEAFEKLFEFLDAYDWHLDDRPLRNDREINPDVLGYIFEKYINQKQMGAYYTKEDITEYISKNTVIPFLFDEARKNVPIAFDAEHSIWDLLTENPDRYIYPAVRHGAELPLPENIAIGLDDVSQRGDWNTPAPSDYGLPTEIWRETVARRNRYAEVRGKLANGDVRQINDLITLNLDIQQFAQDVIGFTDSPDVIRALWKALNCVTVLDPTCGSGAFLFAALNILEPLYEACLERMEAFIEDHTKNNGHPQQYSDFREVMERINQHPNRRYFILKSIIIQNLYGVDIMEEAVEIAKLRLFLKLMSQVDDKRRIEPLPDIDFNIRAGNTLVGFATKAEMQGNLFASAVLPQVEVLTGTLNTFRREQLEGNITSEQMQTLKQNIRDKTSEIIDVLDEALAPMYGFDKDHIEAFRKSHQPFHWFAEFYNILNNGGFDVIIGNPPYVEYSKVRKIYTIFSYETESCGNLYAYITERSFRILAKLGRLGFIVPLSIVSTKRMGKLQNLLILDSRNYWFSNFDVYPSKLFDGAKQRLTITLSSNKDAQTSFISTGYIRWKPDERAILFPTLVYNTVDYLDYHSAIPKAGKSIEVSILQKLQSQKAVPYVNNGPTDAFYVHRIPYNYVKAMNFIPFFWSERDGEKRSEDYKPYYPIRPEYAKPILATLNSNLFFWRWYLLFEGYHCGRHEVETFPLGLTEMDGIIKSHLTQLADELMEDYKANSERREAQYKTTGKVVYEQFSPRKSKHIIDEVDRVLARHYGFTDEELDFIINYDIKYRMGDDLGGEEGEE